MSKPTRALGILLLAMVLFVGLSAYADRSPQDTIAAVLSRLMPSRPIPPPVIGLPPGNMGLIDELRSLPDSARPATRGELAAVLGVHFRATRDRVDFSIGPTTYRDGVRYREGVFKSYDGLQVPYYEIQPDGFDQTHARAAVVLFSGHGNMDQIAFDADSYQRGAGLALARSGFLVFVMENRGMGKLGSLGDHNRIDAVARMLGGSWYGEVVTDGLVFLDFVFQRPYVNGRVGVGGVSSGGALSLMTAALDERVAAAYVQGYLGSYRTTFGTRASHDICNNIPGILQHFDMSDIAMLNFPRPTLFVNGKEDKFDYRDARVAFQHVLAGYSFGGAADSVALKTPDNVSHEFSTDLARDFFSATLLR